jgi:membrane-associated phospholipid phosphatase
VLAYGGAPAVLLVTDYFVSGSELRSTAVDALLIVESATTAGVVEELVKAAAGRKRPFVHALALTANPADNNTSFHSGHTSFVASVAAAADTCASRRHRQRAWAVWVVGAALTLATDYLRIAADQHHATDVLTGAAVGGGIGFAIPYLAHRPAEDGPVAVSLVPSGSGLALRGEF